MKQAILLIQLFLFTYATTYAQFGRVTVSPSTPKVGQTFAITVKNIKLGGCVRGAQLLTQRNGSRFDIRIDYITVSSGCTQDVFYIDQTYINFNAIPPGAYDVYVEGSYQTSFFILGTPQNCYGTAYGGSCSQAYNPVCGCDGETYTNACTAFKNGVYYFTNGACDDGIGGDQKADLIPSGGSISVENCIIKASLGVKNVGYASSGHFSVKAFLTTSRDRYTNDEYIVQELGTFRLSSLFAGQEKRIAATYPIEVPDGKYYLSYTVDIFDEVHEIDESFDNNNGVFSNTPIYARGCGSCYGTPYTGYCTQEYEPVCGCDGVTYRNKCIASQNGIYQYTYGECSNNCSTAPPISAELFTSKITETSARLNSNNDDVDQTDWRYRKSTSTDWIDLEETANGYIDIDDLEPSTEYEWQAQSICNYERGAWSFTKRFTTLGSSLSECECTDFTAESFCDDFSNFEEGTLGTQSSCWTTSSGQEGGTEDGKVVINGNNTYVSIRGTDPNGGDQDIVLQLGDRTNGKYELKFEIWLFPGIRGYYNILHQFAPGEEDREIAQNVYFDGYSKGRLEVGGEDFSFRYSIFKWIEVKQIFDITANTTTLYIDGREVHTWPFSYQATQTEGTPQLSAVNFYPLSRQYEFLIDDFAFETVEGAVGDTPEQRNITISNQLEVYPNPTEGILTIALEMNSNEQVEIEIFNTVGQVIALYTGNAADFSNLQLDLSNQENGIYFVRLKAKDEVISKQFLLSK